ncbi:addiction module protein [Haloferula sp. BvORR071]|uniref:addiction module protein n=1 Tax=Haloferula sp. BvORR071 TaxID=1396141 RepID=UPI000552652A|nr:addiction module protein [Haloferula sp. BvORR071]
MLAAEEISRMSKEERLAAMDLLWRSFSRDGIEITSPSWHEGVLTERSRIVDSADAEWLSLEQLEVRLSRQ